ncbi:acyltransferase family protein [Brevundimonas sp.]|jgi:peptidoglycan/LPS O-acetylase OafA/YrhL|uniref:acyltransferase family protein n=1 Tax=Brevundimonas sp. TaxID=1871086 RepID=UPI002E12BC84|nr:acyltransferase family protein [Brevundimonas sp.]
MTSIPAAATAGDEYRPDVDGLRAVAVLAVVIGHAWPSLAPGGFFGVDVFFVISGYLITRILMRDRGRGLSGLLAFYERRVRRILPALAFMIAAVTLVGIAILIPQDLDLLGRSIASVASLSSNRFFLSLTDYFAPEAAHQPLLHTWSLSIEEQFYLLWPLATLAVFHPRMARLASFAMAGAAAISFAEAVRLSWQGAEAEAFYMFRSRAWELLLGALLATLPLERLPKPFRKASGFLGMALIFIAFSPLGASAPWPAVAALAPCAGAALVITSQGEGFAGKLLSSAPAVGLGLISYSLYIWHWPLLSLPALVLSRPLTDVETSVAVIVALVLAWASWRWVERPFRAGPRRGFVAIGAGVAVLATLFLGGAALGRLQGLPIRAAPGVMSAQSAALSLPETHDPCHNVGGITVPPRRACIVGDGPRDVVVWGDSHGEHIVPLVVAAAPGSSVRHISKSSCPPASLPGVVADCAGFISVVLDDLAMTPPRTVVLAGRWSEYVRLSGGAPAELERSLDAGLGRVRSRLGPEVKLVLWGPTPEFAVAPTLCWARAAQVGLATERCAFVQPRDRALVDATTEVLRRVAERHGIELVLPFNSLCGPVDCRTVAADGSFLFRDDDHLTVYGARSLASLLAGRL